MKVLGIIAEYNPFHDGHIYHISQAKKITNADYIVIILSGPFTEAGNISIIDKYKKAELALKYGADLVIELPQIYAISSAHYFAEYSIKLLDKLNIVDYVCFGSECDDVNKLIKISDKINKNEQEIWNSIREEDKTQSFAMSREKVLKPFLNEDEFSTLKCSNDILGLEYVRTLKKIKTKIKPFTIKRNTTFKSATYIRNSINNLHLDSIKNYIPNETYNCLKKDKISNETLYSLVRYKILTNKIEDLTNIKDITEGLENKLKKEIIHSIDYNEFIQNVKSKRYQMSKIKRILINILLNITKDDFNYAVNNDILYAHILKCNENGKLLLSEISKNSDINIITSVSKLNNLSCDNQKYLNMDIMAQNIYDLISNKEMNKDYTNKL